MGKITTKHAQWIQSTCYYIDARQPSKGASGAVCHGIVHGAFSEMHVANWGVRQLIYDPNTNDTGIRIKLIEFWDYVAANPKAFSKILGAKIA